MENKETLVICISGGLDSFTMFHYANRVFNKDNKYDIKYLVVVDEDSPYYKKELDVIYSLYAVDSSLKFNDNFNFVHLKGYGKLAKTDDHVILGRNAVIASIASAIGENIWIGGTTFENNIGMYDKNMQFYINMTNALSQACRYKRDFRTTVISPFQYNIFTESYLNWDKHNMIIWLENQGIKEWRNTVSCFHPTQLRCGKCTVCYKRYIYEKYVELTTNIRYTFNGFLEDTYAENPLDNFFLKQTVEKMKEAVKNKDYSRYHLERIKIYNKVLVATGFLQNGELLHD